MDIVDLQPAIDTGDMTFIRDTFRSFVGHPHDGAVRCDRAGQFVKALDRVCGALADAAGPSDG